MSSSRYTDRAREIIDYAIAESQRLGDASTGTVHLLLGMIREGHGIAGHVLAEHDLDVDTIARASKSLPEDSDATLEDVERQGMTEAAWFAHKYQGTEHLLLAVCCIPNCRAARLLHGIGKSPLELCHTVIELLGHDDEWHRWVADHPQLS